MGAPREEFGAARYDDVQVRATLTRPFSIGRTEVTREQWASVGWKQPAYFHPAIGESQCRESACPIVNVTFFDAIAFANRYSEVHDLPTCYVLGDCTGSVGHALACTSVQVTARTVYDCLGYRLPTEAEWEYAARAGTTTAFYSGDIVSRDGDRFECYDEPGLEEIAWYCANAEGRAHQVAQKRPNSWGLYDMLGNVLELCNDVMDSRGYGKGPLIDPVGSFVAEGELVPSRAGVLRVARGGNYLSTPRVAKVNARMYGTGASSAVGFRLARTLRGHQ